MLDAVISTVCLVAGAMTFVVVVIGAVIQEKAEGRVTPERRAALRAAWRDIGAIECRVGLEPTRPPWWLDIKPVVEYPDPPILGRSFSTTGFAGGLNIGTGIAWPNSPERNPW